MKIQIDDIVQIDCGIGGRNGTTALVLSIANFESENKYLLRFPNGVEFWTNSQAIQKIVSSFSSPGINIEYIKPSSESGKGQLFLFN